MSNIWKVLATVTLLGAAPPAALAQQSTITGAAGGAATGAIVGGPVGAAVGGVIGGAAGAAADAASQPRTRVIENPPVVIEQRPGVIVTDPAPTVSQRTCVRDSLGNTTCREVVQ
jgi:phage tail tape-measure protein